MIQIHCPPWHGLGTALTTLSLLSDLDDEVHISTTASQSSYHEIKEVFSLPKIQVSVSQIMPSSIELGVSDLSKLLSPYFDSTVTDQRIIQCKSFDKKVIVLTLFNNDAGFDFNSSSCAHLYNRYYSTVYSRLFELSVRAGFEILTINYHHIRFQELVSFLSKHCACIIGEGGIAHLGHVLKIPNILFPWHHLLTGEELDPTIPNPSHLYHLDKRTFFVENIDSLTSWTPEYLRGLISSLNSEQGNNIYIKHYTRDIESSCLRFCSTIPTYRDVTPLLTTNEQIMYDRFFRHKTTIGGL